jgi:hypothetical protein
VVEYLPGMLKTLGNPIYLGGGGRRIMKPRPTWAKLLTPYLRNKIKTKGLRHGLRGRTCLACRKPWVQSSDWGG